MKKSLAKSITMVETTNDPWGGSTVAETKNDGKHSEFEDNFNQSNVNSSSNSNFTPLPDSQEYLAGLEKKLKRIQKGSSKSGDLLKCV